MENGVVGRVGRAEEDVALDGTMGANRFLRTECTERTEEAGAGSSDGEGGKYAPTMLEPAEALDTPDADELMQRFGSRAAPSAMGEKGEVSRGMEALAGIA
jgi:hypothetical protein